MYRKGEQKLKEDVKQQSRIYRTGKSRHAHDAYICCYEFKENSNMVMESRKGNGFSVQIYTKNS